MLICLGTTPAVQKSMTFDRLVMDDVNRTAQVAGYASGKSINAARVLKTLDCEPMATGFLGGDTGAFVAADLDRSGMGHDFVKVAAATRTCITLIDRSAGSATELIEESSAVAVEDYDRLLEKCRLLLDRASGVVFSGSLTPGAPADFYGRCVALAGERNLPTVVDAKGEPLQLALRERPMVVKPNRGELEETVGMKIGDEGSLKKAILKLVQQGPRWAVITAGGGATVISDGSEFWRITAATVKVISPIGSGDSFAAGLMAGIAQGKSVPEAARLGAACGAANAMTAMAGHIRMEDVNSLLPRVKLEPF